MCYATQIAKTANQLAERYSASIRNPENLILGDSISGFSFPTTPIILNSNPSEILSDVSWGLIPSWSKDDSIRKNTLNARIETANEKPSFRNSINKRCLVIASGFYEWRWNDEKGKSKQKYLILSADQEIFSMAGIFAEWINPETKQEQRSYAILTTQANQTMQYIHNTKQRMPVLLNIQDEINWLAGNLNLEDLTYPKYDTKLFAIPV